MKTLGMSEYELGRYLLRLDLQLIRTRPMVYLQEVLRSLATYWLPYHTTAIDSSTVVKAFSYMWQLCVAALFFIQQIAIWGACLSSLLLRRQVPFEKDWLFVYAVISAAVLYVALISCAFHWGEPRYRSVTELLTLFAVTLAAVKLWESRQSTASAMGESVRRAAT